MKAKDAVRRLSSSLVLDRESIVLRLLYYVIFGSGAGWFPFFSLYLQQVGLSGMQILALGIIGIVCCWICGIIAWVMGNGDLREMDAGMMDPSGRGLTQAGKTCGIISVVLAILGLVFGLLYMLLGLGMAASQMQRGY